AKIISFRIAEVDGNEHFIDAVAAFDFVEGLRRAGAPAVAGIMNVDLITRLSHLPNFAKAIDDIGVSRQLVCRLNRSRVLHRTRRKLQDVFGGHIQAIAQESLDTQNILDAPAQGFVVKTTGQSVWEIVVDADQ